MDMNGLNMEHGVIGNFDGPRLGRKMRLGGQDMDIVMQATNSQADKTTAVNPMKELRIEKLVISQ